MTILAVFQKQSDRRGSVPTGEVAHWVSVGGLHAAKSRQAHTLRTHRAGAAMAALACLLAACTTASAAESGTRELLRRLDIDVAAMSCVGSIDAPGQGDGVCTIKTHAGDILVSHCSYVWPAAGCTVLRPGASQ